jgi:phenylacetate-CoA ligase
MSRVLGRADDMIIVRGVNVFPSQVEAALLDIEHIAPHYCIVLSRENHLDVMEVQVEVTESFFREVGDEVFAGHAVEAVGEVHQLEERVRSQLREALGLNTRIKLLGPGEAPRSQGGKLRRVIDNRTLQ